MPGIPWVFVKLKLLWEFALTLLVTWCSLYKISCEKFLLDLRPGKTLSFLNNNNNKTDVFLSSDFSIGLLLPTEFWVWHLRHYFTVFSSLTSYFPLHRAFILDKWDNHLLFWECCPLLCSELFLHLRKSTLSSEFMSNLVLYEALRDHHNWMDLWDFMV